jgi:hypothetical protein
LRTASAPSVERRDQDGKVLWPHWPAVLAPEARRLRDHLDRHLSKTQPEGHGDPMVAIQEAEVVVEAKPQRYLHPMLPDACFKASR